MRLRHLILFSALFIIASCQKEAVFDDGSEPSDDKVNNGIAGDYTFIGLSAQTLATLIVADGADELKTITTTNYSSKNNIGGIKFTADKWVNNALGYEIDTTGNLKTYLNGVLFDDSDFPFNFIYSPNNLTYPYVKNATDSITVAGQAGFPSGPAGSIPNGDVGFKLKWSKDTLFLTVKQVISQTVVQNGIPATITASVNGLIKLKKK